MQGMALEVLPSQLPSQQAQAQPHRPPPYVGSRETLIICSYMTEDLARLVSAPVARVLTESGGRTLLCGSQLVVDAVLSACCVLVARCAYGSS